MGCSRGRKFWGLSSHREEGGREGWAASPSRISPQGRGLLHVTLLSILWTVTPPSFLTPKQGEIPGAYLVEAFSVPLKP